MKEIPVELTATFTPLPKLERRRVVLIRQDERLHVGGEVVLGVWDVPSMQVVPCRWSGIVEGGASIFFRVRETPPEIRQGLVRVIDPDYVRYPEADYGDDW